MQAKHDAGAVAAFSPPRTRAVRWLMRPHRALSPSVYPILLANYFANATTLALGGLNSTLVAGAIALWLKSGLVAAIALADLALLAVRLAVRARCHRNAARGARTATDLYVLLNLLWPSLQGCVSLLALLSGDWPSIVLASVSAMAVMGPLCVRNFSVPNLATAQCIVLVLPIGLSGFFVEAPLLYLFAAQVAFAVLAVRGVTRQVALLAGGAFQATLESERKALRDDLTGLGNRRAFERCRAASTGPEATGSLAMMCLDLDGFKPINDTYGHLAGDQVLAVVAGRLCRVFAERAEVFRLGGDEFAVIGRGLEVAEARGLGARAIDAIAHPISLDAGPAIRVGVTIGCAVAPAATTDPSEQFRLADAALYRAKAAGKGRVEVCAGLLPAARSRRPAA